MARPSDGDSSGEPAVGRRPAYRGQEVEPVPDLITDPTTLLLNAARFRGK